MALPMSCRNAARVATVRVEAELLGHDAGQERDFLRVVQDVLAVAGAELQPPHQAQHLGVQVVEAELEGGRFSLAADRLLHLGLDLLDDLFDAGRVDAAVGDQPLDRLAGDLAAQRIEARKDDRARRVVDDQLDAGRGLERADVAPLAADDPPFRSSLGRSTTETVVSMACSAALRWMASAMICWARAAAVSRASVSSRLTRLAASRRASPSSCFSSSSRASSALSPATRCSSRCRSATSCSARAALAAAACFAARRPGASRRAEVLLEPIGGGEPVGERAGLVGERLLEREDLLAPVAQLVLGLGGDLRAPFRAPRRGFLAQRARRRAPPASGRVWVLTSVCSSRRLMSARASSGLALLVGAGLRANSRARRSRRARE